MKKFILSLMMLFCLTLCGVGLVFTTGCNGNVSTSDGGGTFEPAETPEEDNDDLDDEQAEAQGNDYYWNVTAMTFNKSGTAYTTRVAQNPNYFDAYWRADNSDNTDWAESGLSTKTPAYGVENYTFNGASPAYIKNVQAIKYKYSNWISSVRRYGEVVIHAASGYSFCGIGPNSYTSYGTTADINDNYYFYNNTYTSTKSTAKSGCGTYIQSSNTSYTYYLIFREDVTITLNPNGGMMNSSTSSRTYSVPSNAYFYSALTSHEFGTYYYPTRTGYTFSYWGTTTSGGIDIDDAKLIANATFYAQWRANEYGITFDDNFPSGATGQVQSPFDYYSNVVYLFVCYNYTSINYATNNNEDLFGELTEIYYPTCNEYTCTGFRSTTTPYYYVEIDDYGYPYLTAPYTGTSDLYMNAVWEGKGTSVTLDKNGGSGGTSSLTLTVGGSQSLPSEPTKTGYSFRGYTLDKSTSLLAENKMIFNHSGDMVPNVSSYTDSKGNWTYSGASLTLYAQWTPNNYEVTFDANGGSLDLNSTSTVSASVNGSYGNSNAARSSFTTNEIGWWESNSKGTTNTFALARINLAPTSSTWTVSISFYQYSESNYDYVIFGKLNVALGQSATADSDSNCQLIGKGVSGYSTVVYTGSSTSSAFIDVKFIKDGSNNRGRDSVMFKVNTNPAKGNAFYGDTTITPVVLPKARTGYTFAGYQSTSGASGGTLLTNTSGTLSSSWTYTTAKTIYARWTPVTHTAKIYTYGADYSSSYSGTTSMGTYKITYYYNSSNSATSTSATSSSSSGTSYTVLCGYQVKVEAQAASGFHFMGFSTSSTPPTITSSPSTTYTFTPTASGTTNVYLFFKRDFEVKKDSVGYYIEAGYLPQTKFTGTKGSAVSGKTFSIVQKDVASLPIYVDGSTYYVVYKGNSYRFDPVKWRVNWTAGTTYGKSATSIEGVSDGLLLSGQVTTTANVTKATYNWSFTSSDLYTAVKNINAITGLGSLKMFDNTTLSKSYDTFTSKDIQYKVKSGNVTSTRLRVASVAEITSILTTEAARKSSYSAFAADLAGKTSGSVGQYWTRNLGTYTQNGIAYEISGVDCNMKMDSLLGVKLAYTIPTATYWG